MMEIHGLEKNKIAPEPSSDKRRPHVSVCSGLRRAAHLPVEEGRILAEVRKLEVWQWYGALAHLRPAS